MASWRDRRSSKPPGRPRPGSEPSSASPSPAPPPQRAGWRKEPGSGPAAGRRWQEYRTDTGLGPSGIRRIKLAASAALILLLLGAFIVWLNFRPRPVPLVALAVTEYRDPIPPNSLAREDLQRFEAVYRQYDNVAFRAGTQRIDADWKADLDRHLAQIRAGGPGQGHVFGIFPDNRVFLLYLSAHGVVDSAGRPCLLTSVSEPWDEGTWLPVRELLEYVDQHERLRHVRKVVLLDGAQVREDWSLGVLHNGFADLLAELVTDLHLDDLYVVTAARADQRAWAAPELGGSVFAFFLADGLRGGADRDGDARVSLEELHRFLVERVDAFVHRYRTAHQQPQLLRADSADFDLAYVTAYRPLAAAPIELDPARGQALDALWARVAERAPSGQLDRNPMRAAEIQSTLARLEELLLAGSAYQDAYQRGLAAVDQLLEQPDRLPLGAELSAASLPLLTHLGRISSSDIQQAAKLWNQRANRAQGEEKKPPEPAEAPSYLPAVAAVWNDLASGSATLQPPLLDTALEFLDSAHNRPVAPCREAQALRMLRAGLDWPEAGSLASPYLALDQRLQRAAAPDDVRVSYWIQGHLERAWQEMRRGRDALFVGSPAARARAQQSWQALEAQLTEIEQITSQVADALATRDRVWSDLPELATWLLTCPGIGDRQRRIAACAELAEENRRLADLLDQPPAGPATASELQAVADQANQVRAGFQALMAVFAQTASDLAVAEAGTVRETLHRIAVTLRTPIPFANRGQLRAKYLENLLAPIDLADLGRGEAPPEATADGDGQLEWLTGMPVHPALALIDLAAREGGGAPGAGSDPGGLDLAGATPRQQVIARRKRLAAWGGQLRDQLRQIRGWKDQAVAHTDAALASSAPPSPAVVRRGISAADRLVRSAAGLLGRRPWLLLEQDPSELLRRLDTQFLLLEQAEQTVEDFWGPAQPEGASYFAVSARQLLQAAQQLYPAARTYHQACAARLEDLEQLARNWAPLAVHDLHVAVDENAARQDLAWSQPASLPEGIAAVFLRSPQAELLPVQDADRQHGLRRHPVAVEAGGSRTTLSHWIPLEGAATDSGFLDAVTWYRGHMRTQSFALGRDAPAAVVHYRRPPLNDTRVRVRGDSRQKTQIVFVLDCSSTMSAKVGPLNRLQVARRCLHDILAQLDDDIYYVGLIVYGHRAGWERYQDANGREHYRIRPRHPQRDRGYHPAADVEPVVPVTPLAGSGDLRAHVDGILSDLAPWGETPLYYAIKQSLGAFSPEVEGPRHVVVITDGENDQTSEGAPPGVITTQRDVEAALDALTSPPQVDIIGFNREMGGRAELRSIARKTGGEFHQATDPKTLLQKLRDSLRLAKFYVQKEGQPPPDPDAYLDLNQWAQVDPSGQPTPYSVHVVGRDTQARADLVLEGGEAIELLLNQHNGRLVHQRYETDLRHFAADLHDPSDRSRSFFVGAHLPRPLSGTEVVFPISIQNAVAENFSPRPRQIWAEIRPLPDRSPAFYLYDRQWIPGTPVPVLRLQVDPWPAEAQQAEVHLWFTMEATSPAERSLPLDLSKASEFSVEGATIQVQPQPGRADEPYRVVVTQQHTPESAVYPLRIELAPPADAITHAYSPARQRVRHVFTYQDRGFARLETPRLLVTPIRKPGVLDSWTDSGPIQVVLPSRGR